jgi:hypothetical protein
LETYKELNNKYTHLRNSYKKVDSIDFDDDRPLKQSTEAAEEEQLYKVGSIRMGEIAEYRNHKYVAIQQDAVLLNKITNDIWQLTTSQQTTIEKIHDHVGDVVFNVKDTMNILTKTALQERNLKDNKCCVVLLISLSLFFLIIIMLNMNR